MTQALITVDDVWKRFKRGYHTYSLVEAVIGLPRMLFQKRPELAKDEFWGLQGVNFDVQQGESLGIIGHNGAGKSTTLKLLFRILRPDKGRVICNGRVGGLIELGAGMHAFLTARENVFINGSILGMTQKQIRAAYASIVEFAELDEFMDMPLKNFSDGMYARLAFSIVAHSSPDVLLVDEVLAVGDNDFQAKCYDWMARRRSKGGTTVMISHNMHHIANHCNRAMMLRQGQIVDQGDPLEVVQGYYDKFGEFADGRTGYRFAVEDNGTEHAVVEGVEFETENRSLTVGDPLTARVVCRANATVEKPVVALTLVHDDPRFPLTTQKDLFHVRSDVGELAAMDGPCTVSLAVDALHLPAGRYTARVQLLDDHRLLFERHDLPAFEMRLPVDSGLRALTLHRATWRTGSEV